MKIMLIVFLTFGAINHHSIFVHADQERDKGLMKMIKKYIPQSALLVSPDEPAATSPIQFYDFNQDGQKEIIVTFEMKAQQQPSPSHYGVIVLKKEKNNWEKVWETTTQGVSLAYSGLADITGDGTKEYLFGITIGASAGNILNIFEWKEQSFIKIAGVLYHKLDLLHKKEKAGIAVWQRYIADAYFVDVLSWNGEKLVLDEKLYSTYYPVIQKFYDEKLSAMGAWFYWYCFADAQIKANKLKEASISIQKGSLLAKKLSMPNVVEDFNKLSKELLKKENGAADKGLTDEIG